MKYVLIVWLLFSIYGCSSSKVKITRDLKQMNQFVYIPTKADWKILEVMNTGGMDKRISISACNLDTTYTINYNVRQNKPIYIDFFQKKYQDDKHYYILELNYQDTIFLLRSTDSLFQNKEILYGKELYKKMHKK